MVRKRKTREEPVETEIREESKEFLAESLEDALSFLGISREDVRGVHEFLDKFVLDLVSGERKIILKKKK